MVTKESIVKDLVAMLSKFGIKFLIILCATLIHEHQWHNWEQMKAELYDQLSGN